MPGTYPSNYLTDGSMFDADLANLAMSAPIFDDQPQYLGHRERIRDDELSNSPASVKGRLASLEGALKVSVVTGLTVAYQAGAYYDTQGQIQTVAAGQVAVADNATGFIFVNPLGAIVYATTPSVVRVLLARVTAVAGTITALQDLRYPAYLRAAPVASAIRVFGGTSNVDKVCTAGEILSEGSYSFRSFTVPAGISITVNQAAQIDCSGDVTIAGTINVTPPPTGVRSQIYTPVTVGAFQGGIPGQGYGSRGQSCPWGSQLVGTGGGQGFVFASAAGSAGTTGTSGDGGGLIWIRAAGKITVTGTVAANGASATSPQAIGSAPAVISGSGAGSGGLVRLSSLTGIELGAAGLLQANGGNGGLGLVANAAGTNTAFGGAGGGGGYIVLESPSILTGSATLQVNGGTTGLCAGSGSSAGNIWTVASTTSEVQGGLGGAYGGNTGSWALSTSTGGNNTYTRTSGTSGQIVQRSFV